MQYRSMRLVRKTSQLIVDGEVRVYHTDKNIIPFSFGNAIYINQYKHTESELIDIIHHELTHAKQKHTIDIVWSEWLCILNWYNPFAWLIRSAIRQNLEFIADNKVLHNGIDKKQYQYLLLKVIGVPQYGITSNFNFTSLKKRIVMMNKIESAKVHFIKFLFVLPLLAVILLAFRNQIKHTKTGYVQPAAPIIADAGQVDTNLFDTIPVPRPSLAPLPPLVGIPNSKGYIITIADNNGECIVIVKNKENKIVKAVSLVDWDKNEKEYPGKYGKIPSPSPAPQINNSLPVTSPVPAAPPASSQPEQISLRAKSVPLIILDGKEMPPATELDQIAKPDEIESIEVLKNETTINTYGEKARNGVIIITTKLKIHDSLTHKQSGNQKYRIASTEEMTLLFEEAQKQNILYVGISNPLKIDGERMDMDEVVVQIEGCNIFYKNGLFYAQPRNPGPAELKVFKKEKNGSLKLMNSRIMTVSYLNAPSN